MDEDDTKVVPPQGTSSRPGGAAPDTTAVDSKGETLPAQARRPSNPSVSTPTFAQLRRPAMSRRFGRYELLLELAAGGMATLYLARLRGPEGFEKLVALKIIHAHLTREQSFVKMFFDEARIAALVHHPNVVQVLDLGQLDDTHYIAMEYVHGKDYRAVLKAAYRHAKQGTPLSPVPDWLLAARIAADAAAGLHAAHELVSARGEPLELVHRDVSPHNILLSYDGHVKLTDFGIAYAKHRITHTDSGVLKGKLAYMAPEQAEGVHIDRRADVFALGIVLWEAVCMRRLFRRETETATLYALTNGDIPRPRSVRADLPAELEQIILRALARRPGVRFQTAQELQRALEKLIARHDDVVGSAELSVVMTTLFSAQRARLDTEINTAMAEAAAEIVPDAPVIRHERTDTNLINVARSTAGADHIDDDEGDAGDKGVSETRLSAQAHRSVSAPPRPASALRTGVMVAVGLGVVALVAVLLWRPFGHPQPAKEAGAAPPPAMQPMADPAMGQVPREAPRRVAMRRAPAKLVITFVVKPRRAEATIHFRGKRYRQNRVDLLVTAGDTTERVRVEAPGYLPLERYVTVRPEANLRHTLELQPKRRRPGIRPTMSMDPAPVDIGLD